MKATIAIMQRELLSLFCTPIGYVVIAGFLLIAGILTIVTETLEPGQPAELRRVFSLMPFALTFIIPAIGMRALSDEYRNGTIEGVMTAPVTDAQLVIGKYLAAFGFYVVLLATSLVYPIVLQLFGSPDWGAILATYLGLLMIGLTFTAVSIFTSSISTNQVVAWILAAVPLALFAVLGFLLVNASTGFWRKVLQQVSIAARFEEASLGVITTGSIVFFVATTALFLFLTTKVVESRRWR